MNINARFIKKRNFDFLFYKILPYNLLNKKVMKAKKSVQANLENKKSLYLMIGFVMVLSLVYSL